MLRYIFGYEEYKDAEEYSTETTIEPPKRDVVIIVKPSGSTQYNLTNLTEDPMGPLVSTLFECQGIFTHGVYPRLVEIYNKTYEKVYWVVQTKDPDVTVEKLRQSGVEGDIYQGEAGLGFILTQICSPGNCQ